MATKTGVTAMNIRARRREAGWSQAMIIAALITASLAITNDGATTGHTPSTQAQMPIPPQPRSEAAAKAYLVFKRHCAGCHQKNNPTPPIQADIQQRPMERASPGAILDLAKLAKQPGLVRPGLPDASPLYNAMIARRMPPPPSNALKTRRSRGNPNNTPGPTAAELDAVRTWILSLEPAPDRCTTRAWQPREALRNDIERHVATLSPAHAARTRFVSLVHLSNGCATPNQLKTYRAAVSLLFNRLSWEKAQARLTPVGKNSLILAVNLDDIVWPNERWDWLTTQQGANTPLAEGLNPQTRTRLGAAVPILRADWLAHMARTPSAYSGMLGLPVSVFGLRAKLKRLYATSPATKIAAVESSEVTSAPRLIARHPFGEYGFMWEAVDPKQRNGKSHLLELARSTLEMLYKRHRGWRSTGKPGRGFRQVALRRLLFRLPNGHIGVMVTDRDGYSLDRAGRDKRVPVDSATGDKRRLKANSEPANSRTHPHSGATMTCLSCHSRGVLPFNNVLNRPLRPREVRTSRPRIRVTRFSQPALAAAIKNDNHSLATAVRNARGSIDPPLSGDEPTTQLAHSYTGDLDLTSAAANAWLRESEFLERLERYDGPLTAIARRLRHGVISRHEYQSLSAALGLTSANTSINVRNSQPGRTRISLWSDKPRYQSGQPATIFAQATKPCRLSVISVDAGGIATVLFPNGFARDNLVAENQVIAIPPKDAAYRIKVNDIGVETIVALCARPSVKTLPGINHDFEVHKFTVLGNWQTHLSDTFELEADAHSRGYVPRERRRRRARRGRSRPKRRPSWLLPDAAPHISARTAISFPVTH